MSRVLSLVVLIASLGLLTPAPAPAAPEAPFYPGAGAYLGASVGKQEDGSLPTCRDSDPEDGRTLFELCVGDKVFVDRVYTGWSTNRWGQEWPSPYDTWSRDQGRRMFISFKPVRDDGVRVTWTDIAAGKLDREIDAQARKIKAFGAPVYLAFHPEPEFDGTVSRFGTHADFRAAWRRVVGRFRAVGATNVSWVLVLMAWTFEPGSKRNPADYYAGPSYVDAVGVDGFNYFTCRAAFPATWKSFGKIFQRPYNWTVAHGEPMIVAETGSVEDPADPERKATWIREAGAWIKTHPNIDLFAYSSFHDLIPEQQRDCDWTVDSSIDSLLAFRELVADPYFAAPA